MPASTQHDVARHQLAGGDRLARAVAQHLGFRRGQLPQGSQGLLGAAFLDDAQGGVQDDDGQDGRRFDLVAQKAEISGGDDQQDDDEVVELLPQHLQKGGGWGFFQLVGTVLLQAAFSFLLAEAAFGHGVERCQDFVGSQGVPVLVFIGFGFYLRGVTFGCHAFSEAEIIACGGGGEGFDVLTG